MNHLAMFRRGLVLLLLQQRLRTQEVSGSQLAFLLSIRQELHYKLLYSSRALLTLGPFPRPWMSSAKLPTSYPFPKLLS